MGYFNTQNQKEIEDREERKSTNKYEWTKEKLISILCQQDGTLDKNVLSIEEIKRLKQKKDLIEQKKYMAQFASKEKERLYEYVDEDDEDLKR